MHGADEAGNHGIEAGVAAHGGVRLLSFPRAYRLKRRSLIGALFAGRGSKAPSPAVLPDGSYSTLPSTVSHGVVRILYRISPRESSGTTVPYQIGFSVPRRVKRAVDRNRLKRLLRAAFQQNRRLMDNLTIPEGWQVSAMVLFRGEGRVSERAVGPDTVSALRKLERDLAKVLHADSDTNS